MDNQDKIFDKFKEAAHNSESRDFPGMEKIWSKVEDKLDKKEDKKAISLWKKIAIAASVLLVISLGSQFFKSDKNVNTTTPKVVINEAQQEGIQKTKTEAKDAVLLLEEPIVPEPEAVKIIEQQVQQQDGVAVNEIQGNLSQPAPVQKAEAEAVDAIASPVASKSYVEEDEISNQKEKADYASYKSAKRESAKVAFADKQPQMVKKSAPLIVLNGTAISHSNDEKRDKMMQAELSNLQPENVDSLVVLDAPLYIIDGIYFSEEDLFGKNPTSPYAPLNQQEIKSLTVLQDLEATSKYGEKGKKGVVIITTKYGKPTPKK